MSGTSHATKQQHEPLNVESDHVKVRQTQAALDPIIWNINPTNQALTFWTKISLSWREAACSCLTTRNGELGLESELQASKQKRKRRSCCLNERRIWIYKLGILHHHHHHQQQQQQPRFLVTASSSSTNESCNVLSTPDSTVVTRDTHKNKKLPWLVTSPLPLLNILNVHTR